MQRGCSFSASQRPLSRAPLVSAPHRQCCVRTAAAPAGTGFGAGGLQVNWRERAGKKSTKGGPKRKGKPAPRRDDHSGPLISGKTHIAKVMAAAGVDSRRNCIQLVKDGRVKINGSVVTEPATVVKVGRDKIKVNGQTLQETQDKVYFVLHKPKGYICSTVQAPDSSAKPVLSIFAPWFQRWAKDRPVGSRPPRLFTVGRLDVNTTGLMLVTNDGAWAQKVAHPGSGVQKEYVARLGTRPTQKDLQRLSEGCVVDGGFVRPVFVGVAGTAPSTRDRVRIVVEQGRNREVRSMIEQCGLKCMQLKRHRIGGLDLPRDLPMGRYRELKPHDVRSVSDQLAQDTALFNKVNRIASSGLAADVTKKQFKASM